MGTKFLGFAQNFLGQKARFETTLDDMLGTSDCTKSKPVAICDSDDKSAYSNAVRYGALGDLVVQHPSVKQAKRRMTMTMSAVLLKSKKKGKRGKNDKNDKNVNAVAAEADKRVECLECLECADAS